MAGPHPEGSYLRASPARRPGEAVGEDWPGVSFIVLGTDAAEAGRQVAGLLRDPYPGPFEIILAAPARSDHPAVASDLDRMAGTDPRLVVVHAKDPSEGALVNAAAFAASHPVLSQALEVAGSWAARVRQAVGAMEVTGADVVGGPAVSGGRGPAEAAIARAMNSRLTVGPRPSRTAGDRGPTDSVRIVAIRREAFERVGGLDEAFAGAREWELQHRVRRSGGMVWLDPSLALGVRAPSTVGALASGFYRTAAWRRRIVSSDADTTAWRYLAPPTLVAALALALVGAAVGGLMGAAWMWWLAAAPLVYALAVAAGAAVAGTGLRVGGRLRLWWAVVVAHIAWGAGFLFGRPEGRRRPKMRGGL